ncbi:Hypothetical protein EIN_216270, partial [Entamoeba invadens IP1]
VQRDAFEHCTQLEKVVFNDKV